jgi:D-sedoheptulose 7-phosphate isomerase
MRDEILTQLQVHQSLLAAISAEPYLSQTADLSAHIIDSYRRGGKLILCGNGGSAADAQHVAAEMVSRFRRERQALPAIALNVNTSVLTAIGNDYAYDQVFTRQVEAFVCPEDVVIGISTSGNSANIVAALRTAKARGAWTVALTGAGGGLAGREADFCLAAPSKDTPRVQEAQITILHIVCDLVEAALCIR